MQFSLRTMLAGTAAIALLVTQWPPYRFRSGPYDEPPGFNEGFWVALGLELAAVAWIALVRRSDSIRHDLDNEPMGENGPAP